MLGSRREGRRNIGAKLPNKPDSASAGLCDVVYSEPWRVSLLVSLVITLHCIDYMAKLMRHNCTRASGLGRWIAPSTMGHLAVCSDCAVPNALADIFGRAVLTQ
jgi:hypothetical protein